MKLEGRRESTNVDDRRGQTMKKAGGLGLGGLPSRVTSQVQNRIENPWTVSRTAFI